MSEREHTTEQEAGRDVAAPARSSDGQSVLGGPLTPASIIALQRAAGNAAVGRALAGGAPAVPPTRRDPGRLLRPTLQRNGKRKTKAPAEPPILWAVPSPTGAAADLLGELDIALRSAPENISGTGVWLHVVVAGGRLHLFDNDLRPLGTYRLQANARLPGDG